MDPLGYGTLKGTPYRNPVSEPFKGYWSAWTLLGGSWDLVSKVVSTLIRFRGQGF